MQRINVQTVSTLRVATTSDGFEEAKPKADLPHPAPPAVLNRALEDRLGPREVKGFTDRPMITVDPINRIEDFSLRTTMIVFRGHALAKFKRSQMSHRILYYLAKV